LLFGRLDGRSFATGERPERGERGERKQREASAEHW
jgi:hypothetical protein